MSSIDALDAQSQAQIKSYIYAQHGHTAIHGTQSTLQAAAAAHPVATQPRPPPMRTLFDGTTSQFRSWKITIEDRLASDCANLTPRQKWIFVNDSLADRVQKRLAHYFESGESRGWDATAFIAYLDTLYADSTTVMEACLALYKLKQRASEPFGEFLVRFESQPAKADKLGVEGRDKIKLLQMALHTDFDARSRMTKIPSDDYAGDWASKSVCNAIWSSSILSRSSTPNLRKLTGAGVSVWTIGPSTR
ncbi:hypothetical protein E4U33_006458 [Claviceps sp. LM78 group G4]|nr:hypothetical protein E4U33_006458 [Claviceps sp. LM78 group G4]